MSVNSQKQTVKEVLTLKYQSASGAPATHAVLVSKLNARTKVASPFRSLN